MLFPHFEPWMLHDSEVSEKTHTEHEIVHGSCSIEHKLKRGAHTHSPCSSHNFSQKCSFKLVVQTQEWVFDYMSYVMMVTRYQSDRHNLSFRIYAYGFRMVRKSLPTSVMLVMWKLLFQARALTHMRLGSNLTVCVHTCDITLNLSLLACIFVPYGNTERSPCVLRNSMQIYTEIIGRGNHFLYLWPP